MIQRTILFISDFVDRGTEHDPSQLIKNRYTLRYTKKPDGQWWLTSWQGDTWAADHWNRVRNFGIRRYRRWADEGVPLVMRDSEFQKIGSSIRSNQSPPEK